MRATTAFKRLLRLSGVNVTGLVWSPDTVTVTVSLRRRRLVCAHCGYSTSTCHDVRPGMSRWRHLDLGVWRVEIACRLRRLRCPTHGVVVEGVAFARPGAHLTRDFDDLAAWLATRTDKTSVARLCRVSWRTVGRACERVVATQLDPGRLDGLFRIGVDEISWRKGHRYLTLVVDHDRARVVWGAPGKDSATLDGFFDELGPERSARIEAVSMDLGPAFLKSVTAPGHAPQAVVCADPFHLVKLVGDALDEVRRDLWQTLRRLPDDRYARGFKGARWALLKNPDDLTDRQAAQLAKIRRTRGGIWRAYEMKEQFRAVFAGDLEAAQAIELLDRWITREPPGRAWHQPTVSRTIAALEGPLEAVLAGDVPTLEHLPEQLVFVFDGTLTPCWSYNAHPELYSGKHHTTGHNHQVACDTTGELAWISDPLAGSTHDKAAWDHHRIGSHLDPARTIADKGYQGTGAITPRKKPIGEELVRSDHQRNTSIGKIRYVIERAIAHIKTWRILHTDYRRPFHTYTQAFRTTRALIFFTQAFE